MTSNRYADGEYADSNPGWHEEDARWKAVRIAEFLKDCGVAPQTICDIGCGTGGVLSELGNLIPGVALTGYEISPQAREMAAQIHPEVEVRAGDAAESTDDFDLAMMIDVFEHVEDYFGFLRHMSGVGKQLLCHVPLDMNVLAVLREHRIQAVRDNVGHLHYFSKMTAIATLEDAGYTVNATRYTTMGTDAEVVGLKQKSIQKVMRLGYQISPDATARILGGGSLLVLATPKA